MANDYENLKDQIGGIGEEENPLKGKKLTRPESYGGKAQLTEDEQAGMDAFLAKDKARRIGRSTMSLNDEQPIGTEGWIPLDRELMGKRSMFYPEQWEFFIRPATVQAIKNWTAIDEERPDVVNNVFNEIIKACVKIDTHNDINGGAGWSQINSWDRFWFITKVREYTFAQGENKIEFEDECPECGESMTYTLTSDALFYDFPDDDLVEKYWCNGVWRIDPSEYGLDEEEEVTLYVPKLGKDEAIIEWATNRMRQNPKAKIDETFLKFLMWMMDRPSRDPQMLERQINQIQKKYKSWSLDMFQFMNDVINNITINPSEQLKAVCPHCSQEVTSTVQFPNGVKALFEIKSDRIKKFGSRS